MSHTSGFLFLSYKPPVDLHPGQSNLDQSSDGVGQAMSLVFACPCKKLPAAEENLLWRSHLPHVSLSCAPVHLQGRPDMAGSQVCDRHSSSSSSSSTPEMWPLSCIRSSKAVLRIPLGIGTPAAPLLLHRSSHLKQARTHSSPLCLPLLCSPLPRFGEEQGWKQSSGQGDHSPKVQAHLWPHSTLL